MQTITSTKIIITFGALTLAPGIVAQGGLANAGFMESCPSIYLSPDIQIQANCFKRDGTGECSTIALDACYKNVNGVLTEMKLNDNPPSNLRSTCQIDTCQFTGSPHNFNCLCSDNSTGTELWRTSAVDLDDWLGNDDGLLVCGYYTGAPGCPDVPGRQ